MNRRHFVKALGAVLVAVSLAPKVLIATTLEEATKSFWPGVDLAPATPQYPAQSFGTLTEEQRLFYSAEMLKRLLPQLPLRRFLEEQERRMEFVKIPQSLGFREWASLEFAGVKA